MKVSSVAALVVVQESSKLEEVLAESHESSAEAVSAANAGQQSVWAALSSALAVPSSLGHPRLAGAVALHTPGSA